MRFLRLSTLWRFTWLRIPLVILGIIGICAAIWYGLAMTGISWLVSPWLRGGLIALILGGIALYYGIRFWRRRRAAKELEETLVEVPVGDGAVLADNMREALEKLRKDGGSTYLYDKPWYVIIGPPGAGKTTALVHSGLEFPGTDKEAVAGFGGTKNCDFWFADDAILIDTAGRYTTQDSDARADKMSWSAFLDQLKKARPNQPVNGVILAFSVEDMMTAGDDELDSHALAVRQRLTELHEKLRIDVPVYVMFTKADMIAGFREYFGPFTEDRRQSVWGVTFQTKDRNEETFRAVPAEFDQLISRLSDEVTDRLNEEMDSVARIAIFGLPGQMALMQRNVSDFLRRVFQKRSDTGAILRGFYFTSGTQEGTPIDQVLGAMAQSSPGAGMELSFMSGKGRSYFLHDLLKKVIFEERDWVGYDLKSMRRKAFFRSAATTCIALACFGAMGLFGYSFWQNASLVREAQAQSTKYAGMTNDLFREKTLTDPNPRPVTEALEVLRDMPAGYGDPREQTFFERMGLSRRDSIRKAGLEAYSQGLERHLRPRMMLYLENRLPQLLQRGEIEEAYRALKVYILLAKQQGDAPEDDPAIQAYFADAWLPYFNEPGQEDEYREMNAHLTAMLELDESTTPALKPNDLLVEAVQQQIVVALSMSERAYASILSQTANMGKFSLMDELSGVPADSVFRTNDEGSLETLTVPGLFTFAGYWGTFRDLLESARQRLEDEDWVLGEPGKQGNYENQLAGLNRDLHALYRRDFVKAWEGMLARVELVPMSNGAPQFPSLAVASSAGASPILKLAEAVDRETRLSRFLDQLDGVEFSPEAVASGDLSGELASAGFSEVMRQSGYIQRIFLNAAKNKVKFQGRAGSGGATEGAMERNQVQDIERRFEKWHKFVRGDAVARNRPVDVVLDGLKSVMTNRQSAANNPTGLEERGLRDALSTLTSNTPFYPETIIGFVSQVEREFLTISANATLTQLERAMAEEVTAYCRQTIEIAAPFAKGGRPLSTSAFGEFFGHDGLMDRFYKDRLLDYTLRDDQGQIIPDVNTPIGARLSKKTLNYFAMAQRIQQAFFEPGSKQPSVTFTIRQETSSDGVEGSLLTMGSRQLNLIANSSASEIRWPDEVPEIILTLLPQVSGGRNSRRFEGRWAMMDFIKTGSSGRPNGTQLTLTHRVGPRSARFRMEFFSTAVPFLMRELDDFRCPTTLQ